MGLAKMKKAPVTPSHIAGSDMGVLGVLFKPGEGVDLVDGEVEMEDIE